MLKIRKSLQEEINRINELLNEMRFDGKSTGLFSDEETTMNELEIEEGSCGGKDLDEEHCGTKGIYEDEEEISMARKNRALRRPYSSGAKFKSGL